MTPPVRQIIITQEQLRQRVRELAQEIRQQYKGEELVLVSILKGAFVFLSDLMREIQLDVEVGFLYLSSYRGETQSQGEVEEYLLPFPRLAGRHVLIVEDILDSGASIAYAYQRCQQLNPLSLRVCVLLNKQGVFRDEPPLIDYKGFDIPNVFVVGYGLDYREKYRHLPYIAEPITEQGNGDEKE